MLAPGSHRSDPHPHLDLVPVSPKKYKTFQAHLVMFRLNHSAGSAAER